MKRLMLLLAGITAVAAVSVPVALATRSTSPFCVGGVTQSHTSTDTLGANTTLTWAQAAAAGGYYAYKQSPGNHTLYSQTDPTEGSGVSNVVFTSVQAGACSVTYCAGTTVTADPADDVPGTDIAYKDAAENGGYWTWTNPGHQSGSSLDEPNNDAFTNVVFHAVTLGTCPAVTALTAASPAGPDGIFLCYNASQPNPMVVPKPDVQALLDSGYWLPYAVAGHVDGGTNLPGVVPYHLACNLVAGQAASGQFVGGGGDMLGMAMIGVYPVVG